MAKDEYVRDIHIVLNKDRTILRSSPMLTKLAEALDLNAKKLDEIFAMAKTV